MMLIKELKNYNTELCKNSGGEIPKNETYFSEYIIRTPINYSADKFKRSLPLSFYNQKTSMDDAEKQRTWMKTVLDLLA